MAQADRPKDAIEHFRQALRLNPDYTEAYFNLALAYSSIEQSSQAVAAARKALELARSRGQTALAKQIEDWLNYNRPGPSDVPPPNPNPLYPMKSHTEYLTFNVPKRMDFVNITSRLEDAVAKSGVKEGLLLCNAWYN